MTDRNPGDAGPRRLTPVTFEGPAGELEGLLETRSDEPAIVAVVCHPHPSHGGTMHNKVVHRTASTLLELGAAVLRFNFRGVGKSAGQFDQGRGELDDARAALSFIGPRFPRARPWVGGFSFGSWIAARLAAAEPGIERLILIAPPVLTSSFEVLRTLSIPKLVIQGTRDPVCPVQAFEPEFALWAEPKQLIQVEGASHFFDRQLGDLSEALLEGLGQAAAGSTSRNT